MSPACGEAGGMPFFGQIMSIICYSKQSVRARVVLLTSLLSHPAFAQATDDVLPPIVVTASRFSQPQTDALAHTTVITAEDIRHASAFDLPTLLQREAGLQLSQTGGPGQASTLFMRGASPAQTLILLDGVPLRREGFSAAPALEHILPAQIERIEIVRGNVSAIYGSGAVGGVIQIFTHKGSSKPAANVAVEVGSHGTKSVSAALSGAMEKTRYSVSATDFASDGVSANNTAQFTNENPDRDGYRNKSIAGRLSHEWGKNQEFGLSVYANEGKFDFDGGGGGTPTDVARGFAKQESYSLFAKNALTDNWVSTINLSQSNARGGNQNISTDPAGYSYNARSNSKASLLQWQNQIALPKGWVATAGFDAGRDQLEAIDYATDTYSRSRSSLHTGVQGKIDAHQLQVNVRHDDVGGSGADTTGFLGYGYMLSPVVKLIANTSTAFNAPTLIQLYDASYGNRALQAEHSQSVELGVQIESGFGLLRATAFRTKTRDQFGYDAATYQTINIGRVNNEGVELSASGHLADTDWRASLTVQNPIDQSTGDTLRRRAKVMSALSASRQFGAWRAGGDLTYTGSRPDGSQTLDAYWLANLTARYAINREWSVQGRLINLFDARYQTVYGYNQLPRSVFVGLNWQH